MSNKRLFLGLGIGLLICKAYPMVKDKLRPMAVKIVEGAISFENTTKSFMEEVNEKVMDNRQEQFRRTAEKIESKSSNSNNKITENIEFLKKQLEELKNKVDGV